MIVRWLGHSCFLFYSKKGSRILTDPFSEKLKYFFPPLTCEIVVISHEHENHHALWRVSGDPYVVKRTSTDSCRFEVLVPHSRETFIFKGLPSYHDEFSGRKCGPNTIFVWEMDQIRVCHLGDLGHTLSHDQIKDLGEIDVLCLPVGGANRTLSPQKAAALAETLQAKMIIPMHYKTDYEDPGLENIGKFLESALAIERMNSNQTEILHVPDQPTVLLLKTPGGKNGI